MVASRDARTVFTSDWLWRERLMDGWDDAGVGVGLYQIVVGWWRQLGHCEGHSLLPQLAACSVQ